MPQADEVGTPQDKRKPDSKTQEETEKRSERQASRKEVLEIDLTPTSLMPWLNISGKDTGASGNQRTPEGPAEIRCREVGPYEVVLQEGQWHWQMTNLTVHCLWDIERELGMKYDQIFVGSKHLQRPGPTNSDRF